jgi:membrane protease subunit HflK
MGRKEKTMLITIIANIVLIILRFFLADISGSIGLKANALHSFADVFVSCIVLITLAVSAYGAKALRGAAQKAAKKIENVLAVFVSLFILYMAVEIFSEAFSGETAELRSVPFAAAGSFLGIIINYFMARYKIYVGEQTGSQSLTADGYHSKMDMYCSIAVLIGLLGSLFGMPSLDKIAAIIAMVLLLMAGFEILSSNLRMLLRPSAERSGSHCKRAPALAGKRRARLYAGIGAAAAAAWLLSGIYIVQWDEIGIVRRLGKMIDDNAGPGIHYRLPVPFDEVTIVKKEAVRKIETGIQELLTGDTNLVNINMSVHYNVKQAADYVLNVTDTAALLKASAAAGIRRIAGEYAIDYLLTGGKSFVEQEARRALQEAMNRNTAGIQIIAVQLAGVSPPSPVMPSFHDLASARQDKMIYINEAAAYQNAVIPQARADAYKQIADAEAYRDQKIKTAEGDAALFVEKQAAYSASRDVTEYRLYLETMEKILPNVKKILLGKNIRIDNAELWLANNAD